MEWHCLCFKDYTRASKTVNYVALIHEGNTTILCTIYYFIQIPNRNLVLFVGRELRRENDFSTLSGWKYSQLMKISGER